MDNLLKLNEVFFPSAPIEDRDLFYGRRKEITSVIGTILEKGQHAVLYGERGVGKTSLSNIIQLSLKDINVIQVTCDRNDDFCSFWKKALVQIGFKRGNRKIGYSDNLVIGDYNLGHLINAQSQFGPTDLLTLLDCLSTYHLFIFDEYDTILDIRTKEQIADTLKLLSDKSKFITLLIIGVADNVDDLIGRHPSVDRCLRQIIMPRMSEEELEEIVINGATKLSLTVESAVVSAIVNYSTGFPHYTHLLAKYACKNAILSNCDVVKMDDFNVAVKEAIVNVQQRLTSQYQKAIITSKKVSHFENVLFALALSDVDEFRCSTANQVTEEFNSVSGVVKSREGITYYLNKLCDEVRGEVVQKVGKTKNIKYRFTNSLMKAFVRMKMYNKYNDADDGKAANL